MSHIYSALFIKGSTSASELFVQQRRAAESSKEQELSLEEINEEIREAREERRLH